VQIRQVTHDVGAQKRVGLTVLGHDLAGQLFVKELADGVNALGPATSATLAEGSIPRWRIPAAAKFCNMMPSLLPISTTKGSASGK
jgi:hypothetical protein